MTKTAVTVPSAAEFAQLRANRDAWARTIARDLVKGFTPDTFTRETFAHLDTAVKTAAAALKACQ